MVLFLRKGYTFCKLPLKKGEWRSINELGCLRKKKQHMRERERDGASIYKNDQKISGYPLLVNCNVYLHYMDNIRSGPTGPGNETSFEQLGTVGLDADKAVDMAHTSEQIEQMPKLLETPEPEKTGKNGKFNLRKSLAWDSAFFTSDGVLDAEELSTMIEGGEKGVKHQLPGIEEEVYRSMESISTLESDNLTLESLEAELFEDIRASIQKSNRASNLNNSSIKVSSGKKDTQAKVNNSSKKVDHDNGKRPAARIKDQTSSIPQPKMISRLKSTSTLTTKRASLSTNPVKKDQDIVKQAHEVYQVHNDAQFHIQHLLRKLGSESYIGQRVILAVSRRISLLAANLLFLDPFEPTFPEIHSSLYVMVPLLNIF